MVNYHPPCLIFTTLFIFFSLFLTHCGSSLHGWSSDETWQRTRRLCFPLGFTYLPHVIDDLFVLSCLYMLFIAHLLLMQPVS